MDSSPTLSINATLRLKVLANAHSPCQSFGTKNKVLTQSSSLLVSLKNHNNLKIDICFQSMDKNDLPCFKLLKLHSFVGITGNIH